MSTLIAPSYHVENHNDYSARRNPNGPIPGQQHYIITKRTTYEPPFEEEIVFDSGITPWAADSATYALCKREAVRLNQAAFDEFIRGRKFTRYSGDRGITEVVEVDELEARRLMDIRQPGAPLTVTPDVEILRIMDTEFGNVLWSDGKVTKRPLWWPSGGSISREAALLISHALAQKSWRTSGAWRKLLDVQAFSRETVQQYKDRYEGIGFHGSDEYTLDRFVTYTGLVLYEVAQCGGALGEDGDAWEYYYLYENEFEARAEYRKMILTVLADMLTTAARRIEESSWYHVAEAWPLEAAYVKEHFGIELPLQAEFAEALKQYQTYDTQFEGRDIFELMRAEADETLIESLMLDEHGWAMYLKGFAKAL